MPMNMRASVRTLLLVAACVALASCDSFLEKQPISDPNVNVFYRSASDFEAAVNAAYAELQATAQYEHLYYSIAELRSDNTTIQIEGGAGDQDVLQMDNFEIITTNPDIAMFWRGNYEGVQRTNTVTGRIENVEMDQTLKDRYIGEAKFIRALEYFNLVRTFGGVPLVTQEFEDVTEAYDQGGASVEEIYQQIIQDLQDAEGLLPASYTGADVGRATKGAAMALLGKVYLTQGDFQAASDKLAEVMGLGVYELLPDYADVFDPANPNNEEIVFAVQFNQGAGNQGSNYLVDFCPQESSTAILQQGGCFGFNQPTQDLADAYEEGDARRAVSMAEGYTNLEGAFVSDRYITKYPGRPGTEGGSNDDWPVLRYADVLLMHAEALNEVGQTGAAYAPLNEVRARAGLDPLSGLSQAQFREAVYHERRVELAFEGHRWFDLVRTGRAVEVMNAKVCRANTDCQTVGIQSEIEPYQTLYPIPAAQVSVGALEQNDGY